MCLILFGHQTHPSYQTILVANRDEYYERATAPLNWWEAAPNVLAGQDLVGGGTWMGVSRDGRWAALTNFRGPQERRTDAPSRGLIVADFLKQAITAEDYLTQLASDAQQYNGFNLLLGEGTDLYYFGNRTNDSDPWMKVEPGYHGLSNALLNSEWPKTTRGTHALQHLGGRQTKLDHADLCRVICDPSRAPDNELPETGVSLEKERMLSSMFIESPRYGTRCTTTLLVDANGQIEMAETTWADNSTVRQSIPARPSAGRQ